MTLTLQLPSAQPPHASARMTKCFNSLRYCGLLTLNVDRREPLVPSYHDGGLEAVSLWNQLGRIALLEDNRLCNLLVCRV